MEKKSPDEIRENVQQKTHELIEVAAREIDAFGDALRAGSDAADDGRLSKTALRHAADTVDRIADAADGKTLAETTQDLAAFSRRRPLAVYGVCALLGFTFARFAAARPVEAQANGHDTHHEPVGTPASSHHAGS